MAHSTARPFQFRGVWRTRAISAYLKQNHAIGLLTSDPLSLRRHHRRHLPHRGWLESVSISLQARVLTMRIRSLSFIDSFLFSFSLMFCILTVEIG